MTKTCKLCSKPFDVDDSISQWVHWCPLCQQARNQEVERARTADDRKRSFREFMRICPPAFQKIDPARLPIPGKLDEVLAWKYGPRGVLLHGETGLGKSRCAWALLHRERMDGRTIAAIDSMAGLEYAKTYSRSAECVYEWVENLIGAKLLLCDDVFKNKLTDSFEGIIFTILDHRAQNLRPTIITCNDTGASLAARMSEDRAQPMLRRLREHCSEINFTK